MAYGSAKSYVYVGGFVGYSDASATTNCYAAGTIANDNKAIATYYATSYVKCTATANSYVGGFIGYSTSTTATGCMSLQSAPSKNDISATSYNNSYSTTNSHYGGFYGNESGLTATNCYRNSEFTCDSTSTLGMAESVATMKTANFVYMTLGWSSEVWTATDGNLPTLK